MFAKTSSVAPASRCRQLMVSRCVVPTHLFAQQPAQLVPAVTHPHGVARVHDPYDGVGGFKVVSPVRSERPLSTHVPCNESSLFVRPSSSTDVVAANVKEERHIQMLSVYLGFCFGVGVSERGRTHTRLGPAT